MPEKKQTDCQVRSVVEAFSTVVESNPQKVAVTCGVDSLTYQELDQQSRFLAEQLGSLGVSPGDLVGVCCERRLKLAVALLGILKAGAAYVPFDSSYPAARLQLMAQQADISVLIGENPALDLENCSQLRFDDFLQTGQSKSVPASVEIAGESLAYVMFTSGTTGTPKGVAVPHRAILRLVLDPNFCELGPCEKILQHSPVAFDASTFEIWGALLNGGELVILPEEETSLRVIGHAIAEHEITTMWLTAGLFHAMVDERPGDLAPLRQLLTGGDVVSPVHARKILEKLPELTLINGYGPTENTTFTCCHHITLEEMKDGSPIPIGIPVSGTEVHILNEELQPVVRGEKGELFASGEGLALGYWNDTELTSDKFICSTWDSAPILYCTGDLVSRRPDGAIEFHGRIDQQVKIRGFRIELGEIETAIATLDAVQQVKVIAEAASDQTDKSLVAFYVADQAIPRSVFQNHLKSELPAHSIPAFYHRVDEIPLNPNGKVDAKALPGLREIIELQSEPITADTGKSSSASAILSAFDEVLEFGDIPGNVNFFDLGATSIQIARVHERVQSALDLEFPITDFFRFTTVNTLSAYLDGAEFDSESSIATSSKRQEGDKEALLAIVGLAGRFPGSPDVETLWENLLAGQELISHFTADELDFENESAPGADPDARYISSRGIVDQSDLFDARHFGIPPKEAEQLDPQHRLMLECAQTVLENAGHDPDRFGGKIGIFCGSSQNSYLLHNLCSDPEFSRDLAAGYPVTNFQAMLGNDKDFLPTRVAYKLNLKGPAVSVQCACSTSLVSVALACESLRSGTCDMALAGGISLGHPQKRDYLYTPEGIASRDGHCRTFDEKATGTVFGEGIGLVALRRLDDALADGDNVIAVIRGFAVNNDGSAKAGYAAPSIEGQRNVILEAQRDAGVEPESIGYVEAHGTGTPLGDPVEMAALQAAFGSGDKKQYCAIGTAKTNVGHLDIAAGITGLIKTALTVQRGEIPPMLHFEKANPNIDFENSAFQPVTELRSWTSPEAPRRAGVSAFGVGGTNVHMILEQSPAIDDPGDCPESPDKEGLSIFPLSASHPEAVSEAVAELGGFAKANPQVELDSIAFTLQAGRREFEKRTVLVAGSNAELASAASDHRGRTISSKPRHQVAFLFPGQGSQHPGMARELYERESAFCEAFDECVAIVREVLDVNLLDIVFPESDDSETMAERLKNTGIAQPAIFAIEYSLARQWKHWGITPHFMIGHSIGEFAAACIAGVMSLRDALTLICLRGKWMADLPGGAMISVRAGEEDLAPFLTETVNLAAVNGANACVISGPNDEAFAVESKLNSAGIETKRLHTSHAFHSSMMDSMVDRFEAEVVKLTLGAPEIPILSTVTGDWLKDSEAADPHYWAVHLRRPVRFYDAMQVAWEKSGSILLEVGPGTTLATLAGQNPDRKNSQPTLASLPHATKQESAYRHIRTTLGLLWCHGLQLDWDRIEGRVRQPRRVALPTYCFQRQRYWIEPTSIEAPRSVPQSDTEESVVEVEPVSQTKAEDTLKNVLSELSGIEPGDLDHDASFLELGFDSLLLTQAGKEIQDAFGVKVSLRQMIDEFPSISQLTVHLESLGAASVSTAPVPVPVAPVSESKETETVSGPATVIDRSKDEEGLTDRQQAHLDQLIARYNRKTAKSKELTARYRNHHADPRTASGFNRIWKEMVYQIVTVQSKGSRLLDVDGNEYIDILNGFGPGFLGHSTDFLVEAIEDQLHKGYEVGPQCLLAMEAAELFCEVTGNERTSFVCTGSEAVQAAMRLARTVTNRDKIVIFARDYHGNFDEVLVRGVNNATTLKSLPVAPGIPKASAGNMIVLPYGTDQSLEIIRSMADQLAAVIVEPVQSRRPEFQPREFIREVRQITQNSGTLFVFDEVVTGFRFGPRGAQEFYGIEADLCTYGKVIGGEMPLGVVSGKAAFMDTFDGGAWQYGDDSFPEQPVTFFAGTFVRHPLAMASVKAMLSFFKDQPPHFWHQVNAKGDQLAGSVNRFFKENNVPMEMPNCGSLMFVRMGENQKYGNLFFYHLREKGVFMLEGFPSYMTAAHSDEDIDYTIRAFEESAFEMQEGGFWEKFRDFDSCAGPHLTGPPRQLGELKEKSRAKKKSDILIPLGVATTEPQREILVACSLGEGSSCAFNESASLQFKGDLKVEVLEAAFAELVERHDALRATFSEDGLSMWIHPRVELPVLKYDLRDSSELTLDGLLKQDAATSYDLENGPLVRPFLVQLQDDVYHFVISTHHLVCDGWSYNVIAEELGELYNSKLEHRHPLLEAPKQFLQHAGEGRDPVKHKEEEEFWLAQFEELPEPIELPIDHPYRVERTFRGDTYTHRIEQETYEAIKKTGAKMGSTLYSTLAAVYQVLVHRLSGQDDVVICIPSAGQNDGANTDYLVGHCVNFLPLRTRCEAGQTFESFLRESRTTLLEATDHRSFTYGELIQKLDIERDPRRMPLLEVAFNVERMDYFGKWNDLEVCFEPNGKTHVHYTMFMNIVESNQGLRIDVDYNAEILDRETVARWVGYFETMIQSVSENPKNEVWELAMMDQTQIDQFTRGWNESSDESEYPEKTVAQLFEETVESDPEAVALIDGDRQITYRELNEKANVVAGNLQTRGIGPWDFVAIMAHRSVDTVAALLGILKTGAAYVPIDPAYPQDRIEYMLEDTAAPLILVGDGIERSFSNSLSLTKALSGKPSFKPVPGSYIEDVAYVIYTSGSTGTPKGVLIPHRGIVRLVRNTDYVSFGPEETFLLSAPISFDASTFELWGPLLNGGKLVVMPAGTPGLKDIGEAIQTHQVTTLWLTSGLFSLMVDERPDDLRGLTQLLTGGDVVSKEHAARAISILGENGKLINAYGPTENTTFTTCHPISIDDTAGESLPIGRPIKYTQCYILDDELRPVAPGVKGRLFIGGDGLSLGYLNNPELTSQKFIANPISGTPGDRLYDSGDECRWRCDGTIEFVGRADRQVKIRGFRIEPGEIENAILAHSSVTQAVIKIVGGNSADKILVAYLVGEDGMVPSAEKVREAISGGLPDYMIPSQFVVLDELPVTANGKVDYKALPDPVLSLDDEELDESDTLSSDTEKRVADLWDEVLGCGKVGLHHNFFKLGGHSLAGLKLFTKIHQEFGRDLPLATLFQAPTVEALSARIDGADQEGGDVRIVTRISRGIPGDVPLFLIHGGDGGTLFYKPFTDRIEHYREVYTIESPMLVKPGWEYDVESIGAIVKLYLEEIAKVYPGNQFAIGGYSFGGTVAYEMASQLAKRGAAVEKLFLFDTPNPAKIDEYKTSLFGRVRGEWDHIDETNLLKKIARAKDRLEERAKNKAHHLRGKAKLKKLGKDEIDEIDWLRVLQINHAHNRMMANYTPGVYQGETILFRGDNRAEGYDFDRGMGWDALIPNLTSIDLPGRHEDIFESPHIEILIDKFNELLPLYT